MFPRLLQRVRPVLRGLAISLSSFIEVFCPNHSMSLSLNLSARSTAGEMFEKVLIPRACIASQVHGYDESTLGPSFGLVCCV